MPQSSQNEVFSTTAPEYGWSDIGSLQGVISQILFKIQTVTLARVVSCTNAGGVSPVGFVDVQPLVHQLTGDMKTQPHGIIYNLPYFRIQGGADAVIIDPKVNDIGMCGFCSRDISSVKNNRAASAPASLRTFDWSDGLYFGGFLNGTPGQYIRFFDGGIEIKSPKNLIINVNDMQINCNSLTTKAAAGVVTNSQSFAVNATETAKFSGGAGISTDGDLHADKDVTAGNISLKGHLTSGVVPGSGTSGAPVAG